MLSTHIVDDVSDVCSGMATLVNGRVQCQGVPGSVVEALRDSVWRTTVTRAELAEITAQHAVLGTRWRGGRLGVHVMSVDRPGPGFERVAPDLQDVYFHTIRQAAPSA